MSWTTASPTKRRAKARKGLQGKWSVDKFEKASASLQQRYVNRHQSAPLTSKKDASGTVTSAKETKPKKGVTFKTPLSRTADKVELERRAKARRKLGYGSKATTKRLGKAGA